jgi:hypothetical protein
MTLTQTPDRLEHGRDRAAAFAERENELRKQRRQPCEMF